MRHTPAPSATSRRYMVAILAFAAASAVTLALHVSQIDTPPFLLFFAAVAISAGYGGLWPGLLCTALIVLAALPISPPPSLHDLLFHRGRPVHTGIFLIEGVLISG